MDKPHFWIFADGSCDAGHANVGAWASVVVNDQVSKVLYGAAHPTTISRCELIPIMEGLRWIKQVTRNTKGIRVLVYSDSEYTVKTLCGVYPAQKNEDLWSGMKQLQENMEVVYRYRQRNTHPYMLVCDAMCSLLRKKTIDAAKELMGDAGEPEKILQKWELPKETDDLTKGLINANIGNSRPAPGI